MNANRALVLGVTGGLAVLAGALYLLTRRPATVKVKAAGKAGVAKDDGVVEMPSLGREQLIKIFERLCSMLNLIILQLAEHEQKVRVSAEKQGKEISHAEMEQYLMGQFRQAMAEVEQTVYKENNTTEEEVRAATTYYEDDEEFQQTLNKLRRLFKAVTGQPQSELPEVPEEVTMEKVLLVMSETMENINVVLEKIHKELTDSGMNPDSQEFKQQMQQRYLDRVGSLRAEVQQKHGIGEVSYSLLKKKQVGKTRESCWG